MHPACHELRFSSAALHAHLHHEESDDHHPEQSNMSRGIALGARAAIGDCQLTGTSALQVLSVACMHSWQVPDLELCVRHGRQRHGRRVGSLVAPEALISGPLQPAAGQGC
jgi:hypothetical protein